MKILFLGLPGSGKSTQGRLLSEKTGWPWISTGELCRNSTDPRIQKIMQTAELVDDKTITEMFLDAMSGIDNAILDGFPRTKNQAEALISHDLVPDAMIEIVVPEDELMERVKLRGREQDDEKIVRERIQIYYEMRNDILSVLRKNGMKLIQVDGVGTIEEISERVDEVLKEVQK